MFEPSYPTQASAINVIPTFGGLTQGNMTANKEEAVFPYAQAEYRRYSIITLANKKNKFYLFIHWVLSFWSFMFFYGYIEEQGTRKVAVIFNFVYLCL